MQGEAINRERWGELEEVEEGQRLESTAFCLCYALMCCFLPLVVIKEAEEEEEEEEEEDVEGEMELHAGLDATGMETPLVDGISSIASGLSTPGGIVDMRKGIRYVHSLAAGWDLFTAFTILTTIVIAAVARRRLTFLNSSTPYWSKRRRRLAPRSMALATNMLSLALELLWQLTGRAPNLVACVVVSKMLHQVMLPRARPPSHQKTTTTTKPRKRRKRRKPRKAKNTRISSFKGRNKYMLAVYGSASAF